MNKRQKKKLGLPYKNIEIGDMVRVKKCLHYGHRAGTIGIVCSETSYDYEVMKGDGVTRFHTDYELLVIKKGLKP